MRENVMTKTMKPRDKGLSKSTAQKKSAAELDEKQLDKVSGGKPCVGGQHIKDGKLTV
jgi:bacteriocin-like protein